MKQFNWFSLRIFIFVFSLSGCSAYNPVDLHTRKLDGGYSYYQSDTYLAKGDKVRYTLKNGHKENITVQSTTPQGIITSAGHFVPYDEILTLEHEDPDKLKILGVIAVGSALAAIWLFGFGLGYGMAALVPG